MGTGTLLLISGIIAAKFNELVLIISVKINTCVREIHKNQSPTKINHFKVNCIILKSLRVALISARRLYILQTQFETELHLKQILSTELFLPRKVKWGKTNKKTSVTKFTLQFFRKLRDNNTHN